MATRRLPCLRYGSHHLVLQRTVVSRFGCFVFEFWVLRFRVLGAPFSSFGCFVFEIWVLRASVVVFECFVFETTLADRLFSAQSVGKILLTCILKIV